MIEAMMLSGSDGNAFAIAAFASMADTLPSPLVSIAAYAVIVAWSEAYSLIPK